MGWMVDQFEEAERIAARTDAMIQLWAEKHGISPERLAALQAAMREFDLNDLVPMFKALYGGSERMLKTSGDLRAFLAECMEAVRNGSLEADKAAQIAKLAEEINESLCLEERVHNDGVIEFASIPLGDLPLAGSKLE